ncbi:hypothetical protein ACKS0A_11472 [Histoplasma ohiense]
MESQPGFIILCHTDGHTVKLPVQVSRYASTDEVMFSTMWPLNLPLISPLKTGTVATTPAAVVVLMG